MLGAVIGFERDIMVFLIQNSIHTPFPCRGKVDRIKREPMKLPSLIRAKICILYD
jgi:hypothetical protein